MYKEKGLTLQPLQPGAEVEVLTFNALGELLGHEGKRSGLCSD